MLNKPGKRYTIRADAESWDGDIVSDSYTITVYKNVIAHDGGTENDLGYAELSRCEWIGNTAHAEMLVRVHNTTDASIQATMVFGFWVQRLGADGQLDAGVKIARPIVEKGKSTCEYFSRSHKAKGIPAGAVIQLEARVTCDAGGGSWTASHTVIYVVSDPE